MTPALDQRGTRLAAVLIVAATVGYIALMYLPRRADLAEMRRQIAEKQRHTVQASFATAEIERVIEELRDARRFTEAWSQTCPRYESVVVVFREINQVALAAGAQNLRLEPEPIEFFASIWRGRVNLSVEGDFSQLFAVVHGLESISPAIQISTLHIERGNGDTPTLRMSLTLTIFGVKPEFSDYGGEAK